MPRHPVSRSLPALLAQVAQIAQVAQVALVALAILLAAGPLAAQAPTPAAAPDLAAAIASVEQELVARHGEAIRPALDRGLHQAARLWRAEDGDAAAFADFARANFAADPVEHAAMLARLESAMQAVGGHLVEIGRALRMHADVEAGAILPFDEILAAYAPDAHFSDDFFADKLAFVVLLNFPETTLEERLAAGEGWTRTQWAEARLARLFARRVPAEATQALTAAASAAESYIASYNLWMHHLLDEKGQRLFPPGLRLITHWNLRDEIKAAYADPAGLPRQRLVAQAMARIVDQSIPAAVIDNPRFDWRPGANVVVAASADDGAGAGRDLRPGEDPAAREPDTRYARLLDVYRAARLTDPYSPTAPTLMARSFDEGRELPEARVEAMFEQVLASPLLPRVAKLVRARLGRPLEPFDIWYNGFRPRAPYPQAELDAIVAQHYPTAQAFAADIPAILGKLGFAPERARWLSSMVEVHSSRGAGHAAGAGLPGVKAYLRTRVEKGGMNYKGYNIAVHELGHNIEQTISLNEIDHPLLAGVPNTAFTEALAFVFQGHDLELLGLAKPSAESRALEALDAFWGTAEIASVALVDMAVWHWMYDHPQATPAELRAATIGIAKRIWNEHWAPVIGVKDSTLLAIYSHMISNILYLPDYPVGHFIAFQIQEQMERAGAIGPEFERMARLGNIAPDLWMKQATGKPVGPEALLAATEKALAQLEAKGKGASASR